MILKPPFYVISDTHWFHKNIVKYCNRDQGHNEIMLKRWNETVGEDDTILHLGDLVMPWGGFPQEFETRIAPYLTGKKYLILGNHDKPTQIDYESLGFTVIDPFMIEYKDHTIEFDHYPSENLSPGNIRVHGHIHNNGYHHALVKAATNKRHVNVSVEVIDYTPQRITELLDKVIA